MIGIRKHTTVSLEVQVRGGDDSDHVYVHTSLDSLMKLSDE